MKKSLIFIITATVILTLCSCKVKPQGMADQAAASVSGASKITFIDQTDKYLDMIGKKPTDNNTKSTPTKKTFELNGQKLELEFTEKQAVFSTWYKYEYSDKEGVLYYFYEDDGFLGLFNPNTPAYTVPISVTQQQALEIAQEYAKKLFPNDFDKYVLIDEEIHNSQNPTYSFMFSKKYGKNNCLNGEICSVDVYKTGEIKECKIQQLYVFKSFDKSLVENITKDDIDKLALQLISKKYTDTADWTVTESSASLQYRDGNWVISLTVEAKNSKTEQEISEFGYFEIN